MMNKSRWEFVIGEESTLFLILVYALWRYPEFTPRLAVITLMAIGIATFITNILRWNFESIRQRVKSYTIAGLIVIIASSCMMFIAFRLIAFLAKQEVGIYTLTVLAVTTALCLLFIPIGIDHIKALHQHYCEDDEEISHNHSALLTKIIAPKVMPNHISGNGNDLRRINRQILFAASMGSVKSYEPLIIYQKRVGEHFLAVYIERFDGVKFYRLFINLNDTGCSQKSILNPSYSGSCLYDSVEDGQTQTQILIHQKAGDWYELFKKEYIDELRGLLQECKQNNDLGHY